MWRDILRLSKLCRTLYRRPDLLFSSASAVPQEERVAKYAAARLSHCEKLLRAL